MKKRLFAFLAIVAVVFAMSMNAQSIIPDDADGDGVPDSVDACAGEDASYFDRDGDGCIDDPIGARHTEYWGVADTTIEYVINDQGSPDVLNGSDFTAIQNAMDAWPAIPGTELNVVYGGTVAQEDADGLDQVNLVTFVDDVYPFSPLVLAVGITTSFTSDTTVTGGRIYRKGEIFDADMIFNPTKIFRTPSYGVIGTDIQSTAAHEAGHLYGLAHTAVASATMFYVLPGGLAASTLEEDDELAFFKAYGDSVSLAGANRIDGVVTDGTTSAPVPGAIVFAIDAVAGDTVACDYTLPDGSYAFVGLDDGSYHIAIHPIDGSSRVGFIQTGNINALLDSTAVEFFVPEYWDAAESNMDDSEDKTAIAVSGGSFATADLVTNIDAVAPFLVEANPASGTDSLDISQAYLLKFSEGIDTDTFVGAFSFYSLPGTTGVGGNVSILNDDSVAVFQPTGGLDYSTTYELRLDTSLKDKAGNGLASPVTLSFTMEDLPPLAITSLAPNKGAIGTTVLINGRGFDTATPPTVYFDTTQATVTFNNFNRLVCTVPSGATSGPVTVVNGDMTVSNPLTYTVLTPLDVARGYESGETQFPDRANGIDVLPDGNYAYVATDGGAEAVVASLALSGYLTSTSIPYSGGLDAVAATPDGRRVYAVSSDAFELVEINSDQSSGILFNSILSTHAIDDEPLGIGVRPDGRRAYIPTGDSEIQIWDTHLTSPTYQNQIGALLTPNGEGVIGEVEFTPDGEYLVALTDNGNLLVYDLGPDSLYGEVAVGIDPRGLVVDAVGDRAYVTHNTGDVSVVKLNIDVGPPFQVQDISAGGLLRDAVIPIGGKFLYVTDRSLDQIKIIDLDELSPTFRTVVADIPAQVNPVDIVLSPDGVYAFTVLQGDGTGTNPSRMLVTTIGSGPTAESIYPTAAKVGDKVVISGEQLGDTYTVLQVDVNGITVPADRFDFRFGKDVLFTVPPGATTGPVRVYRYSDIPGDPPAISNPLRLQVIGETPPGDGMRFADSFGPSNGATLSPAMAISPDGETMYAGGNNGEVYYFDIRVGSPTFHKEIRVPSQVLGNGVSVDDMAVTADGKALFIVGGGESAVPVVSADPNDPNFGKGLALVGNGDFGWDNPDRVATSPDNVIALVHDAGANRVNIVDATNLADGEQPSVTDFVPVLNMFSMAINPTGQFAFLGQFNPDNVLVLDIDNRSVNYGTIVATLPVPNALPAGAFSPMDFDFTQDGSKAVLWGQGVFSIFERALYELDTSDPDSVAFTYQQAISPSGQQMIEHLRISPRGDRFIYNERSNGLHYSGIAQPYTDVTVGGTFETLVPSEFDFTPDGSRLYMASTFHDSVRVFDFTAAQSIAKVSGDNQTGVGNQALPAPLRVQVSTTSGQSLFGVPIRFDVLSGGGLLQVSQGASTASNSVVVATNNDGFAEIYWRLGEPSLQQSVTATATGLAGSPILFNATATADPDSLPLAIAQIVPLNGTGNKSVTTAIQTTFSRGVVPSTIDNNSYFLRRVSTSSKVNVAYGFTDGDRKVSMTPTTPLEYGDSYEIVVTAAVQDTSGGALTNPGNSVFATRAAPPPPTLTAVNPPAALPGVPITLAGFGFDPVPANNTVLIGGQTAVPTSGGSSTLRFTVPPGAVTGQVRVVANSTTSNAKPFTVLVPSTSPIDDVIATVGTGAGTRSLAVTPDGALCYSVSTDLGLVIPVSVDSLTSYPSITVGNQPVAISIHPENSFAYVANFGSSNVSVIDVDPASPNFNTVVNTINVGSGPLDVLAMPDGDRVLVANSLSNNLSVIDGDSSSVTFHDVLATVGTGKSGKTIAVSPDGASIYVGVDDGYIVLDANSAYSVIATVGTGKSTKQLQVSPDGTLLYVLATDGDLLIVDIVPGSSSENQVLATVGTGSKTKSIAVSPDGTLLYLVQEDSDQVLVISVSVNGGAAVLEAAAPNFQVITAFVDTIPTGPEPAQIRFDPSGSGVAIVAQAGIDELLFLNASPFPQGPLTAQVEVTPQTLNLESRGRFVTGCVELPSAYAPEEVDVSTVLLNDTIPAIEDKTEIVDKNLDGIDEIVFKFDRAEFQAVLPEGEYVPVWISGDVRDRTFFGEDTIRTIRPQVTHPNAGSHIAPLSPVTVTWTSPQGYTVGSVDVHYTVDDGGHWTAIAEGVPDNNYVPWTTPDVISDDCRIMVTLYKPNGDVLGMGMSPEPFSLAVPVSVALQRFDVSIDEGAALMRWKTGLEIGVEGFHLVRADREDGGYERVTDEPVSAVGGVSGAEYEYRDEGVVPNRTYWYKLQEVASDRPGSEYGPYKVDFRISNGMQQNVPNPFNPTTAIKFSIEKDMHVRLVVYDVAGRRVATLVDEPKRANFYKVVWDGRNDQGNRVASGVYFYRIQAGKFTKTLKMLMLK